MRSFSLPELLTNSEVSMILNSNFSQDYPDLVEMLDSGIKKYSDLHPFSRPLINRIFAACKDEWYYDKRCEPIEVTPTSEIKRCQLCKTSSVHTLFTIRNKISNRLLLVGSECIKRFEVGNHESINAVLRVRQIVKRYEALSKALPGIVEEFLSHSQAYYRSSKYILPSEMERANRDAFTEVRRLAELFQISPDEERDSIISKIRLALSEYQQSCTQIDQYQEQNRQNWLYPMRSDLMGLSHVASKSIQKTCLLDSETLKEIRSLRIPEEHILPRLNSITSDLGIHFTDVSIEGDDIIYHAEIGRYRLSFSHKLICDVFADHIINVVPITGSKEITFLHCARLHEKSEGHALNKMFELFRSWNAKPLSFSLERDVLHLHYSGKYVHIPIKASFRKLMPFILRDKPSVIPPNVERDLTQRENQFRDRSDYQLTIDAAYEVHDPYTIIRD